MDRAAREWDLCLAAARFAPTTGAVVVSSAGLLAKDVKTKELEAALAMLLADVESIVDMGMPFTDSENGFHESVMAARKALGR